MPLQRSRRVNPPREASFEVEQGDVRAQIEDCLEQVPARQRMAFVLREVQGMNTDEVCSALEVSVSNLGVLLFRARNRLRECLETKGVA